MLSITQLKWQQPPEGLTLPEGEIHVYQACLDWDPSGVERLRKILSEDEQRRSQKFYFPKDEVHFIVAHGLLRIVLGQYLGIKPAQVMFSYNANGKPMLDPSENNEELQFNLSRSLGQLIFAVARDCPVGVDIESLRPASKVLETAARFFSPREAAAIKAAPPHKQEEVFYLCWTRKEAYIKASDQDIITPMDKFDVSIGADQPPALIRHEIDPSEVQRWHYYPLPVVHGYVTALAAACPSMQLKAWRW